MNTSRLIRASVVAVVVPAAPALAVNQVQNPGFEINTITSAANSLGNFPGFQGVWGQEQSVIVGAEFGVSPAGGVQMLRMENAGGVATQAFQTFDVTSFAGLIDSGNATVVASALFNSQAQAAVAGIYISYFTAANFGSQFGPLNQDVQTLDASPQSWQPLGFSASVPALTRWMMVQVAFNNASIMTPGAVSYGYVDDVGVEIIDRHPVIPLPSAAGLGLAGLAVVASRRRR